MNWIMFFAVISLTSVQYLEAIYRVISVVPWNEFQFKLLQDLENNHQNGQLDFWHSPHEIGDSADIMVSSTEFLNLKRFLTNNGMRFKILLPDVQKLIDKSSYPTKKYHNVGKRRTSHFDVDRYHSYDSLMEYLRSLPYSHPNIVRIEHLGKSHEQRDIIAVKIGKFGKNKRKVWIDGGIHGREWIAPHTATFLIHKLLQWKTDKKVEKLLEKYDWYIAPLMNPDGYAYTQSEKSVKARLWRKNRRPKRCVLVQPERGVLHCCSGVDLNRNFDFHHPRNKSADPCDINYAGSQPFTEPETRAMHRFFAERKGKFDIFISLHSYGQTWVYPFGHKWGAYPTDRDELERVSYKAKNAIQGRYGTKYKVGSSSDIIYLARGTSVDWAKDKMGIKYTFLIELRPTRWNLTDTLRETGGFLLEEHQLRPTSEETWDAIKIAALEAKLQNS